MGIVQGISFDEFPLQSEAVGRKVVVCWNYDTSKTMAGEVVRDDIGKPGLMIIKLEDGRHMLSTECMWRPE